jgi:hypothetical protein
MMLQQKSVVKRTLRKETRNSVLPGSRQTDLRSPVEGLLRDIAFVLHATEMVRRTMEAERAMCSTAS